jgi:hypothetical protein
LKSELLKDWIFSFLTFDPRRSSEFPPQNPALFSALPTTASQIVGPKRMQLKNVVNSSAKIVEEYGAHSVARGRHPANDFRR